MAEHLSTGETVRAEEIVLGVHEGRSVVTLLNATPILSDEVEVESLVVALQDMAEIKEQDARLKPDQDTQDSDGTGDGATPRRWD